MRVNYITYKLAIINKAKEEQILNHFNGTSDLLEITQDFCKHILSNIRDYTDNQGKKRTFTLASLPNVDNNSRNISGFFDSAYTGEKLKIKESISNKLLLTVNENDLQSRDFFFLIHIPKGSKYAYLVLQKKKNHGIKSIFIDAFNQFLKLKGYMDSRLTMSNAPSYSFLIKMLENGNLKEIKLIKNSIGTSNIEQFGNPAVILNQGSFEKVLKLNNNTNTQHYKKVLYSLFHQRYDDYEKIRIEGINEEYDELAFKVLLNNSNKTYYIKKKHKIKSNIDVTDRLAFINDKPTWESLINTAIELIDTIINGNNNQQAA